MTEHESYHESRPLSWSERTWNGESVQLILSKALEDRLRLEELDQAFLPARRLLYANLEIDEISLSLAANFLDKGELMELTVTRGRQSVLLQPFFGNRIRFSNGKQRRDFQNPERVFHYINDPELDESIRVDVEEILDQAAAALRVIP